MAGGLHVASATTINIPDASFENTVIPAGQDWAGMASPWAAWSATPYIFNESGTPNRFPLGIPDGAQALSATTAVAAGAIYQMLPDIFEANTTYTLSGYNGFEATAASAGFVNGGGKLELYSSADGYAVPLITIDFAAGTAPEGGFQFGSGSFTTEASGGAVDASMLVRIGTYGDPNGGPFPLTSSSAWDGIQLEATAVPEPGTLMLLASGLLGLLACTRRNRK